MTQATKSPGFPTPIRAKPEYFVGELGRHAVHYLLDRMFRSLVWGCDESRPGKFSLVVSTDGTLRIERNWPGETHVFPGLGQDWVRRANDSLLETCFSQCVSQIQSGQFGQLDWTAGNPFVTIFLPVAFALSHKGKLTVASDGMSWTQVFKDGAPETPIQRSGGRSEAGISIELQLDHKLLGDELQVYPFRIRLREFASLIPGLEVSLKYKSFQPLEFKAERGMEDLLNFFVPLEDRLHEEPFSFRFSGEGLEYECSLYLIHSAMERFKAFASFDESYHGGQHERLLRKTIRGVFRRLNKLEIPVRRQSLDNIASSRMSYFGQFGATVPYNRDQRKNEHVRTVPGVAATVVIKSPGLEWDTNYRARLVSPQLGKELADELEVAFRNWVLGHAKTLQEWRKQWIPKKRRSRKTKAKKPTKEPSNLQDIDKVAKEK